MRRLHLFELEDQHWFPSVIRDAGTAYIRLAAEITGQAKLLAPVLARALERNGSKHVVDLCSADAVRSRQPIAAFEIVSRHPLAVLGVLLAPIAVLLLVPLLRPFRWSWLFFTYVIPMIPIFVLWDGLVSCFRTYSEPELSELISGLDAGGYSWEIGRVRLTPAPIHATYLLGHPGPE